MSNLHDIKLAENKRKELKLISSSESILILLRNGQRLPRPRQTT
jgi:hypothetical protein